MPISRHVRITRTAISPRLAMRTFWSTLDLSSGERASQLHAPYGVRHVGGAWDVRWLRRDRLDQHVVRERARRGRPRAWSWWPTTRPPAGAAWTGAGSRPRGEPAGLGPPAPRRASRRRAPLHGGGGAGGGRCLRRGGRGRAGAEVAERPAGGRVQAGRRAGRGGVRRRHPAGGGGRDRAQRGLAGPTGAGAPAWTTWACDGAGGPAGPARPLLAPGRRGAAARRRAGRRELADEVRPRCATLGRRSGSSCRRGVHRAWRSRSTTAGASWSRRGRGRAG